MLKHNVTIAYRSIKKDKTVFFINLIGLTIGLVCALVIYLWVNDELMYDKFNKNDDRLYKVMSNYNNSENIETVEGTPGLLAESMAAELPEVEYAVAAVYYDDKNVLSVGDKHFKVPGRYAGPDFFKVFSYELLQGDKTKVLSDINSIVLSERLAEKLFGSVQNAMGKVVEFQRKQQFVVSGIFKDVPVNTTDQFQFLLPYSLFKSEHKWTQEWGSTGPSTYVLLKEGVSVDRFNEKIRGFVKGKMDNSIVTLFATRFSDVYLHGNYENGKQVGGRIQYVRLFSIIAIFILLIACINYTNLSTAKASLRIKEIAIKKVVGVERWAFVKQYLTEALLMSFLSLILAVLMTLVLLPLFNQISGKQLSFHLSFGATMGILGIALLTGTLSGIYPALYLSRFSPIAALSGRIRSSVGELWARRGLVFFQFIISTVLITGVWIIYNQIRFIQTRNLGYDRTNVVYFEKEGRVSNNLEAFINRMKTIPGVLNASSAGYEIGSVGCTYDLTWEGKSQGDANCFQQIAGGFDLIETLGIRMKEGRSFSRNFGSDSGAIVLNETAVKVIGLKDPIGKRVKLWGKEMQIIGVTKDFFLGSLHQEIKPLFFYMKEESTWMLMAKIDAGREKQVLAGMQQLYTEFNPGFELEYKFLNESYRALYASENHIAVLSRYFAGLAILISCLGLFGLATFSIQRRRKEIGVRKALGASAMNITYILTSEFTKIVLVSVLIALPLSFLLAQKWLNSFVLRIELSIWYFLGAGIMALVIAWLTVGIYAARASQLNPKDCLQD